MSEQKCVIIVNENLPLGQIANTTAVLTATLGKKHPEIIGCDLVDQSGHIHHGITTVAIPILKAGNSINRIRDDLKKDHETLTVVDLISATSNTRSYEEYADKLKNTPISELNYYGIAIYGPKKTVNKYAGSLGLLK